MEPLTLVLGVAAASASLVSALASSWRERKEERRSISVTVDGQTIELTSANRKVLEDALAKAPQAEPIKAGGRDAG